MTPSASRSRRLSSVAQLGVALAATAAAWIPLAASARPWPIPQSRWTGSVQDYPAPSAAPRPWWNSGASTGDQVYATPLLTPDHKAQHCNTRRLIGVLRGRSVVYAMIRDDARSWVITLSGPLGYHGGYNASVGRGPRPL